jgi:epsilon-lactone hydrolase
MFKISIVVVTLFALMAIFYAKNDQLRVDTELAIGHLYYTLANEARGNRSAAVASLDSIFVRWSKAKPTDNVFSEHEHERAAFRAQCDIFELLAPIERGARVEPLTSTGFAGEWIHFDNNNKETSQSSSSSSSSSVDVVVLYLHGGGYALCSAQSHRGFVSTLVRHTSAVGAVSVDYRLAPESTLEEALDDALAGYLHALTRVGGDARRVVVMGDSAGGGLAVALLVDLKRRELPQPRGAVLFSPWLDLTSGADSYQENEESDAMVSDHGANDYVRGITRGNAETVHRFSAATWRADDDIESLRGLAPQLIFASSTELLRDDSIRYDALLRQANVDSTLDMWSDMPHIFPFFAAGPLPEVMPTIERLTQFLND